MRAYYQSPSYDIKISHIITNSLLSAVLVYLVNYTGLHVLIRNACAGQGGNPVWNERLIFRVEYPGSGEQYKLTLKIMDKDTFTADDTIGEAT